MTDSNSGCPVGGIAGRNGLLADSGESVLNFLNWCRVGVQSWADEDSKQLPDAAAQRAAGRFDGIQWNVAKGESRRHKGRLG